MRVWLVMLLIPLAGCLGAEESAPAFVPDASTEGNVTVEPTVNNTAPVLVFSALVDNLTATFAVDVSDVDGDNVTWVFEAGDGNTTTGTHSASFNHTYASAGEVIARVNATDGDAFTEAEINFTLKQAVAKVTYAPGQVAAGSFDAGGATLVGCFGDIFGVGFPAAMESIFFASFEVEPHTIGYSYVAAVDAIVQDSPGFAFLAADRSVITSGFMSTHAAGQVPEEAAIGVWWTCAGALADGTYESTPPA